MNRTKVFTKNAPSFENAGTFKCMYLYIYLNVIVIYFIRYWVRQTEILKLDVKNTFLKYN
jgi:hypothetical protein